MKKRFFSLFCALTMLLSALPAASALEGEARRAADMLYTLGLVENVEGSLTETANRLTAVSLLIRLSGEDTSQAAPSTFSDVPAEASRVVGYAAARGWVGGIRTGVFGADQPLTANAWFTMLMRMLGYKDSEGDFTVPDAAVFALRIGLCSRPYEGQLSLGDLMESGVEALHARYKGGSGTVLERLVSLGRCDPAVVNALGLTGRELTARQAADRYMSAVFCLTLYETQEEIDAKVPAADASGFFISADGLAVTCYHSIDEAILAYATLSSGEVYPVESVLWYDVGMDLAVLRISKTSIENKTTSSFAHLDIAGTEDIRPGDDVYTLSNPLGLGLAVSSGVISAIARDVDRYTLPCVMNTATISSGSSGGALINVYGRVLAVTSGAYRAGNNMYLAVPADTILTLDLTVPGKTLREVAVERAMLSDAELSGF